MQVVLELLVCGPLCGGPQDLLCELGGDQLKEDSDPQLLGQLQAVALFVPALHLLPSLDGCADAGSVLGPELLGGHEFLHFDELAAEPLGVVLLTKKPPLFERVELLSLRRFHQRIGVGVRLCPELEVSPQLLNVFIIDGCLEDLVGREGIWVALN